jgi:hypothetical protein
MANETEIRWFMRCGTIILLAIATISCSRRLPPQNSKTQATQLSEVDAQAGVPPADVAAMSVDRLIDQLTEIDAQTAGLHSTAFSSAFIADNTPPRFAGGVLGSRPPKMFPQMQELVRRGVSALPSLIQHLDDRRPTKLTVGGEIIMWAYFSDEYDPKDRSTRIEHEGVERDTNPKYTVRVGDVCYVLVGQIVNRDLLPVHYQPTGGMVINSPIEQPSLIRQTERDWNNVDSKAHMESLVAGAQSGDDVWSYGPALQRLRFYFPDEYRRQGTVSLTTKIKEFESSEENRK